ncbi:MAG TPA: response regulator transcription factor [Trebonia sp.]
MAVLASDALMSEGTVAYLRARSEVRPVAPDEAPSADVVLVIAAAVSEETLAQIRDVTRGSRSRDPRFVLVVDGITEPQLMRAVASGVVTVLPRKDTTYGRIVQAILQARDGLGDMPPEAIGWLSGRFRAIQEQVLAPHGLTVAGLRDREVEVLRLLADGLDTAEIALRLSYSERTVKNIIHGLLTRLNLRNRSHAVAYALRNGVL